MLTSGIAIIKKSIVFKEEARRNEIEIVKKEI